MSDLPVVSIIICTRDRARDLAQTLEAIGHVSVPADLPCELLVVDNGSSDETARIVQECRLLNMAVRYVLEARRGKGFAYNTGLASAWGSVFLFTDDDVRPPQDWVEGMCRPLVSGQADAVAGGVTIAPHLEREWLGDLFRAWLASTEEIDPTHPSRMVGANMAFSRRVLERVPAFDTELGPGALGFGDETLFTQQLLVAGYRVVSAFDVSVIHHFAEDRLQRPVLIEIARRQGRTIAYLKYHWEHEGLSRLRLRLASALARRSMFRLRRHWGTPTYQTLVEETRMESFISLCRQFLRERRRPRNYDKHGLRKRATGVRG